VNRIFPSISGNCLVEVKKTMEKKSYIKQLDRNFKAGISKQDTRSQGSNLLTSQHEPTQIKSPKLQKDKEISDDKGCVVIFTKVSKNKIILLCILTTCSSHGNNTHLLLLCNHHTQNNKPTFSEPILVVFPKLFCSGAPFGFEKSQGSSHPCLCKYTVSG